MLADVALLLPGPAAAPIPCDPERLGQKGAGLCAMSQLGLPVPPGLILPSALWPHFQAHGHFPDSFWQHVEAQLAEVEAVVGARLGDLDRPLLLSVRSGAKISMPGMLDSLLNVGLTEAALPGLARRLGDPRCAADCYRRFLHQYAALVLGLRPDSVLVPDPFEMLLFECKQKRGVLHDEELSIDDLMTLARQYQEVIGRRTGSQVPDDARTQLREAVYAVLRSFHNPRAQEYRRMQGISADMGTAVTLQAMVFGNLGSRSATGVVFSRDPRSGEPGLYGEFLPQAQGDDLVSGGFTPRPIAELGELCPEAYQQLIAAAKTLEQHFSDLQDIEFTIENGRLYLLQTRSGKRSARAMVRVACDLVREGQIVPEEALRRCDPKRFAELLLPMVDTKAAAPTIARGLPASPGAAAGTIVFTSQDAVALRQKGLSPILIRAETSTDDIVGIEAAAALVTARGGMTSHAAVVARGMGRCAIVGCSALRVDVARQQVATSEYTLRQGDAVTVDGHRGLILLGALPLSLSHVQRDGDLSQLIRWAMATARVPVWARLGSDNDRQLATDLEGMQRIYVEPALDDGLTPIVLEPTTKDEPVRRGELVPLGNLAALQQAFLRTSVVALATSALPDEAALAASLAAARTLAQGRPVLIGLSVSDALAATPSLYARAARLGLDFVACPVLRTTLAWLLSAHAQLAATR
jgi:pyruvate,orthophosphate dikinase